MSMDALLSEELYKNIQKKHTVEFTDALSSENYISVSYVKPVLHLLNTKILAVEDEDTDLTKTIKSKILNYINKHYEDETTQELLDTATFLDSRFKTSYTDEDKLPNIKARVMSDMEMSSHKDTSESVSNTCRENPDIDLPPPGKKAWKSLGSFFKTTSAMPAALRLEEAIAAELNSYLLSPSIDSVMKTEERHFAEACARQFLDVANQWGIAEK
ncbi:zinc finger BED domain-containing 1-like protein [Labeo rohita]|uniref:Zinc finger BED domain-containing 1-like protein n=1 Tax=Labeo rohita TaxID=84645 RepID=A0A498L9P3_LABRO|nr:zinc finger BED domain-containing 1-like protein [Labeo rohita]